MNLCNSNIKHVFLALLILIIALSCSKSTSISSLIKSKSHDKDGLYYIEYDKPQDPEKINKELLGLNHKLKDGYYIDGLDKKTDQYKFVWFYGKEYESLAGSRKENKIIDSLLSLNTLPSFIKLLNNYPKNDIIKPEEKGLEYIKNLADVKLYNDHFGTTNSYQTKKIAQGLVKNPNDLLGYRNIFGTSEFTEQSILRQLTSANLEESKLLLDNFHDSKHKRKIELNFLSKSNNIREILDADIQKKYFSVDSNFDFKNTNKVQALSERMSTFFSKERIQSPLIFSLYDEHVHLKSIPLNQVKTVSDIDQILSYVEENKDWLGNDYLLKKEEGLIKDVHKAKYGTSDVFKMFYADVLDLLEKWQWKNGTHVFANATLVESLKGAKRQAKKANSTGSTLEDIFFDNVDNKNFKEISSLDHIDDYSFIRFSGSYTLSAKEKLRLPFYIIFELNSETKNYKISEMVISEEGAMKTYFNGKSYGNSIYFQHKTNKLMKKGKR